MKDYYWIFIALCAAAAALLGYWIMKRLDKSFAKRRKRLSSANARRYNGQLRIALEQPSFAKCLADGLAKMKSQLPGIEAYLLGGTYEEIIEELKAGRIDAAVIMNPIKMRPLQSIRKVGILCETDELRCTSNSARVEPLVPGVRRVWFYYRSDSLCAASLARVVERARQI